MALRFRKGYSMPKSLAKYHSMLVQQTICSNPQGRLSSTVNPQKDIIGPPNAISNLRPVIFHVPLDESQLEREFRVERQAVQHWNEAFWVKHNTAFLKESEEFRLKMLNLYPEKKSLNAEEMSEFYKAFLDKNWKTHVTYNFQWYIKNFSLAFLAMKAKLFSFRTNKYRAG